MTGFRQNWFVFLCASFFVASCATNPVPSPLEGHGRIWPDPPAAPRIAYVGQFSRAADFGIEGSFWQRIVDVTAGKVVERMSRPMAVVADAELETIFVADPDNLCVHRYDLERVRYRCIRVGRDERPVAVVGLALSRDGRLFAADSRSGRLLVAKPGASELEPFFTGSALEQPTGLYWDEASARLYVTDTKQQAVLVFDSDGNLERKIGGRGNRPGEFNYPTYLWLDNRGEIVVSDSLNFRIQRLSPKGDVLHVFGKNGDRPGDLSRPKGVAVDSHGHIYVVDALMHLVQVFDRDGRLLLHFGGHGQGDGQFWLPNGIFVTEGDLIMVSDTYNQRVQVFRYVGAEP